MDNHTADVLRQAFPGLEGDGIEHLIAIARERCYPPDTVVAHEEETDQTFFLILQGRLEVTQQVNGGAQRVLQRYGRGEFFGEMALIETLPRTATVRTLMPSTLLEIDKDDFDQVLSQYPALALTVMRELTQRLRQADQIALAELRQKNEELERANSKLMRQEQYRSDFLTSIAHELRTPLTVANGYLSLIADGTIVADQMQQAINRVARNVKRVVRLVNDILFLQEMDLILPEFRRVSLGNVISQVAAGKRQQAIQNGVSLRVQFEEDLPQIVGDPEWLNRAVDALLDNAIKFSPNGGEVSIHAVRQFGEVQLTISDQGLGMSADQMDRIFGGFQCIEQAGPYVFGGVGLGLPMVKQVMEQHGGRIEVDSVEGQGSSFVLRLPAAG